MISHFIHCSRGLWMLSTVHLEVQEDCTNARSREAEPRLGRFNISSFAHYIRVINQLVGPLDRHPIHRLGHVIIRIGGQAIDGKTWSDGVETNNQICDQDPHQVRIWSVQ
eukprot:TRINITY_DN7509_c0_g1_i1.p1 TRINITY_DN7509_c0_g1~~TRINITY_DN7509_c0_g1_i1.p1  ORF type:complete len:110 (+),score=14.97 TRINITY_DN7509_c0_g1_i1:134-463(+)